MNTADALAREALSGDLTAVAAWRTLGLVKAARGDAETANRLMNKAGHLTSRDLPLRLWMIESAVQRNDIPGALRQYDIALRAHESSWDLLLPILLAASDDPAITLPLARLLASEPLWKRAFFQMLVNNPPRGGRLPVLLAALQGSPAALGAENGAILLERLVVHEQQYELAARSYAALTANAASARRVRNGDFASENPYPPFDWELRSTGNVLSEVGANRGDRRLIVKLSTSGQELAARQFLSLPAGRHTVSFKAGATDAPSVTALRVVMRCVDGQHVATSVVTGLTAQGRSQASNFSIPANCRHQWIEVLPESDVGGSTEVWVDDVDIR